ncbi:MAG: hypothetical protein HKN59_04870 [Gammaproteobacteria bacterium]|nr:hypothetical protein [Gammaproteobacteria bacterium]
MRKLCFLLLAASLASSPVLSEPIDIQFVHPSGKKANESAPDPDEAVKAPTTSFAGWPLSLELTMNDDLGIASENLGEAPVFPLTGDTGFVVFSDPDGCLVLDWQPGDPGSWSIPSGAACFNEEFELVITESDETYFEFTPDQDALGVADSSGNPRRIAALMDATSGRPIINPDGGIPSAIGPPTSKFEMVSEGEFVEIVDGYGYGADDDVPGLVIVARHGPGIVYFDDGTAGSPLQLRNLAGFITSVGYELSTRKNKTAIQVQLMVPPYLIAPVVIADDEVSGPPGTPAVLWRLDGSAMTQSADEILGEPVSSTFETGYPRLVGHLSYNIHAMAVSGTAPDTVIDLNGDGHIDHHDLELMGYTVLSKTASVSLRVFPAQACHGGSGDNTVYADLDGNGSAVTTLNCPSGSGSISKPPR